MTCVKLTGCFDSSIASIVLLSPTWLRSMSIPRLFISSTRATPKFVSPPSTRSQQPSAASLRR